MGSNLADRRLMAGAAGTLTLLVVLALVMSVLSGGNAVAQEQKSVQGATIPVRTASVELASLRQTATVLGEFQPLDRVQLVSRASARVTSIRADVGQAVKAGEVLIELDRATQEAGLGQAQAQLAVAKANLSKLEAGARPEDIAAARAGAQQAIERLAQAQATATDVRAQDIANAQAAVAAAEARLRQVVAGPTEADIASAEAALRGAEARLRQVTQGATTEADIANAEAALRGAQARYQQVLNGPKPQDIDVATQALRQQQENRARLESQLGTLKEQARLALDQAADQVRQAQAAYGAAKLVYDEAARTGKDPNIPADSCPVVAGKRTKCNELSDVKLRQYKANYESAQLALSQAETAVEGRRLAYEDAKQQEIASLRSADAAIQQAQATLDKLLAGASPEEAEAARSAVDQAQAMLDKLTQPMREADVATAQAGVDQARAALEKLQLPARESDIAAARAAVDQARAMLAKAQAAPNDIGVAEAAVAQQAALVSKATDPYLPADLEAAQAQVLVAEAAIKVAEANLRDTTIVAPFDGVIAVKNISVGSLAAPGTPLLEIISLETRGVFTIEEAQVGAVQIGQPVVMTTTAYPGQTFDGTVSAINPSANASTRSFGLRVTPNDTSGRLRAGMSAQGEFVVAQRSGALSVPESAVLRRDGKTFVFTVADGKAQQREVTTGIEADGRVEIASGLSLGEPVIVVGQNLVTDGDAVTATPR